MPCKTKKWSKGKTMYSKERQLTAIEKGEEIFPAWLCATCQTMFLASLLENRLILRTSYHCCSTGVWSTNLGGRLLLLLSHPVVSGSLHPVVSGSLRPHGLQHARPPCPSPSPGVCPSSCSLHRWCCPDISFSDALFSFCPQFSPASGTFPMSHLLASDDQNTGASALAPVLPVNIQGWSPLRLEGGGCPKSLITTDEVHTSPTTLSSQKRKSVIWLENIHHLTIGLKGAFPSSTLLFQEKKTIATEPMITINLGCC